MLLDLRHTTAGQQPWSNEPFFPMTPKTPLPPPEPIVIKIRVPKMQVDPLIQPDRKRLTKCTRWIALVVILLMLLTASAVAQNGSGETYTPEELQQHFQNVAEGYKIQAGRSTLTLRKRPLMNWQNSVRQQEQGAIFAWEKSGRPVCVGIHFYLPVGRSNLLPA